MKVLEFVLFLLLLKESISARTKQNEPLNFARYTRVHCNSSGLTCVNPKCSIKLTSRFTSFVNFSCEFKKPIHKFYFTAMNWKINLNGGARNLVNLKNIEVCPLLENVDKIPPLLKHEVDFLNETFPGMIHKCPYTKVHCINATLQKKAERPKWQWFPDGMYKVSYKGSDDIDDNIFTLVLHYDRRLHTDYDNKEF